MKFWESVACIASLALLCGCPNRPQKPQISLLVAPSCLTKEVEIEHCDTTVEPPKCAGPVHVHYKKGCEQIKLPKDKQ
jgi:hypothetical protein